MERKVSEITSRRCRASAGAKQAIHAAFIWGKAATLLRPLRTKTGTGWLPAAKLSARVPGESVVEKHLVDDQRQAMLPAQGFQRGPVRLPGKVPGGIIGVDDDNGPAARGDAAAQGLEVKMPAVIVEKLIGNQPHVVEPGQEIEEGIAWLANQHLVAGIAQQPEQEAVGLAGAGGE